ncbi:MAG: 4Fe-4S binding protein, partial [Anaerolineae bacterium]|nr:4Fe-4S binding protein [Anaerolineae bacterium]
MFGLGIAKGLGITLKHFINTFVDDLKYFPKSAMSEEAFASRQGPEAAGLFTVEYPEMKLRTPENFRFLPFLITDYEVTRDDPNFDREAWSDQNRCTSCGICAKVCPPQCIWIVRTDDPETGKPIPQPAEFYIDTDICMNCGYCAEYCPFDAIKMDHDFELADYERDKGHIHDLERLMKPASYYAAIRPTWNALETERRRQEEEEKARKAAEKAAAKAQKEAEQAAAAAAKKEAASDALKEAPPPPAAATALASSPINDEPVAAAPPAPAKPDDLKKIEGIGPKIATLLNEAGITTFAGLAKTEVSKIREILEAAGPRYKLSDPETWPEQAALAAEGKW